MKTNLAASVRQRLLDRSRSQHRPFDELLQFYAMERFLYRLSRSDLAGRFILKGALMLRVWESPESCPTRDIDFLGRAEKCEAMVQLGELNSRMKDFYDIWLLARQFEFELDTLKTAIERTFAQRETGLPEPPLFPARFVADRQSLWKAFRDRLGQPHVPERFDRITEALDEFLAPVIVGSTDGKRTHWPAGGPWWEPTDDRDRYPPSA